MGLGIGTGEILLVLVVALIIWGPGRLPEIARTVGRTVRALRKASSDFTTAITREITAETDEKETQKKGPPEPERSHHISAASPSSGKTAPTPGKATPTPGAPAPAPDPASPPPGTPPPAPGTPAPPPGVTTPAPKQEEKPASDAERQQS